MQMNDKLILLIEECSEVIQAATKCLRFGYDHYEPGYGFNDHELAKEIGQMIAHIGQINPDIKIVIHAMLDKLQRTHKLAASQ